jgi:lipid II isoglutaminyl synthase (glutamine-hydrolysing)
MSGNFSSNPSLNNDAKLKLRIAHLYAHFLNIYGDRGNIIALKQRACWRGIDVEVDAIGLNQQFEPDYYDLFFVGGGQDKQQQVIAMDLQRLSKTIHAAVHSGSVMLSICGGYQLLGHCYRPHEGDELKGISLIDAHTVAGNKRMIGNVAVQRQDGSALVGFENHSGKTFLGSGVQPLGKVTTGNGNNGDDGFEGVAQTVGSGMVYGTYLHGSLLPKNPLFTDELIAKALSRRHGSVQLAPLDDILESRAHQAALKFRA